MTFEDDYGVLLSTFVRCVQLQAKELDRDAAVRRVAELCAITETQMDKYGVTPTEKMQVLKREAWRPVTRKELYSIAVLMSQKGCTLDEAIERTEAESNG